MHANDQTVAKGSPSIALFGPDGSIKEEVTYPNLVVDSGLGYLISRALDASKTPMSHMALGEGTTAAAAGDTALETPLGSRVAFDSTNIAGPNGDQVVYTATFGAGEATGAVTEAGVFNAATGGEMLCRTVFPVVNKQADDTMVITWTVTLSS